MWVVVWIGFWVGVLGVVVRIVCIGLGSLPVWLLLVLVVCRLGGLLGLGGIGVDSLFDGLLVDILWDVGVVEMGAGASLLYRHPLVLYLASFCLLLYSHFPLYLISIDMVVQSSYSVSIMTVLYIKM